jgi:hypothetical protein
MLTRREIGLICAWYHAAGSRPPYFSHNTLNGSTEAQLSFFVWLVISPAFQDTKGIAYFQVDTVEKTNFTIMTF